eukprot:TRINITY_DN3065_c0_g1_i15.p1 TRINITY_DN3065_c0_g1~~TRINITY_DN3065_c0_g1_i15.p1  ORF type:complete len:476 (-),score=79.44 TRINITY_DN3065_c0_g1_i15:211-1638(-)
MDRLYFIKDEMFSCEAKVDEILSYIGIEASPDIVLENLNLILALLTNCRSHIDVKLKELKFVSHKKNQVQDDHKRTEEVLSDDIKVEVSENGTSSDFKSGDCYVEKLREPITDSNNTIGDPERTSHEEYANPIQEGVVAADFIQEEPMKSSKTEEEIKSDLEENIEDDPSLDADDDGLLLAQSYCKSELLADNTADHHMIDGNDDDKIDSAESHSDAIEESSQSFDKQSKDQKNPSVKEYACDICNRKWQSKAAVIKHKKTFDHETLKCQECNRYFPFPKDLKRHMLCHSGERPYCCDICGKTLRTKWTVQFHKERVHGNKKKDLPCKICGKTFAFEEYLKSHIKIAHNAEKSWACEQCGDTFNLKSSLVRHMQKHTEDRPFSCDICEKSFKSARDLGAHQRTHSIVKPYQCEECDVALTHQSSMVRHYRTVHKMVKHVKYKPPVLSKGGINQQAINSSTSSDLAQLIMEGNETN